MMTTSLEIWGETKGGLTLLLVTSLLAKVSNLSHLRVTKSRWVDTKIKGEVNKFTSKENYQFGDMTKEILRRVATGQYTLDDLFMLLKALAIFQASISPIGQFELWCMYWIIPSTLLTISHIHISAGFLPVKLLVQLLDYSLLNDVAGRVTSALALELDKRLKKSLLGDENYKLGDATKRTISNAVKSFTGKGLLRV
jgi:hypothetical protein